MRRQETIDDLCPAAYQVFGLVKTKEHVCKETTRICYAPRLYGGCPQYTVYLAKEAESLKWENNLL